jgi:hypothetical protein
MSRQETALIVKPYPGFDKVWQDHLGKEVGNAAKLQVGVAVHHGTTVLYERVLLSVVERTTMLRMSES